MDKNRISQAVNAAEKSLSSGGLFRDSLFTKLRKKIIGAHITLTLLAGIMGLTISQNVSAQEKIQQTEKVITITTENIIKDVKLTKEYIRTGKYDEAAKLIASLDRIARVVKDSTLTDMVSLLTEQLNQEMNTKIGQNNHIKVATSTNLSTQKIDGKLVKIAITKTQIKYSEKDQNTDAVDIAKEQTKEVFAQSSPNGIPMDKGKIIVVEREGKNGFLELFAWAE